MDVRLWPIASLAALQQVGRFLSEADINLGGSPERICEYTPWIAFETFAPFGHALSLPHGHRASTAVPRLQAFAYSRRKPSPQRLIWPTEGDGKCIVQHNVSVSQ